MLIEKPFVPPPKKELLDEYFELSEVIKTEKDVPKKINACRRSFKLLPYFAKYWLEENDELPPTIMYRDVGINFLMRAARWQYAEEGIKICAEIGAYTDGGISALDYFNRYKKAAFAVIIFLTAHPAYTQKDIYKALPDVDQDCLKAIMRSALFIRKVKFKDSNLLYIESDYTLRGKKDEDSDA